MNTSPIKFGSFEPDWIKSLAKQSNADDIPERLFKERSKVFVLSLDLRDGGTKAKTKILYKVFAIRGVTSVSWGEEGHITVIGTVDVDPQDVLIKLSKYRPTILKVQRKKNVELDKEGGCEKLEAVDKKRVENKMLLRGESYRSWMPSLSWKSEGPGDSDSGNGITVLAGKPTTTALNMMNSNYDWHSFCKFLSNLFPPSTPSCCSANDVIDFLCKRQVSDDVDLDALVDSLSTMILTCGVDPEKNPFRSLAVTTYLKVANEKPLRTEYIFVFTCNDNLDVDEASFIEAISKELCKGDVTPLTYNLSATERLDEDMLCRSGVCIMILSHSYVYSRQSLDHLLAIMKLQKDTGLVVIPIFFKVSVCEVKNRFEAEFLQLQNSVEKERVQEWKAAMTEIVSIGGLEWTKGTKFLLAEKVVRHACLRVYLKNSKNLRGIVSLLINAQSSGVEIVGIWGMAGIGKTSIARETFDIAAPDYDLCYFVQDFHLMCQMKGLRQMREDFFSKLFGEEKLRVDACDTKLSFLRGWFHNRRILVVIDDVSNAGDAEALVGGFGWLSHGHTIILTSRRKQVLVQCKANVLHEITKLSEFESYRLCKQYLNEESAVISELMSCSSGIPLALKVLVSSVSEQHIDDMKEHLQSLRKNPPIEIQEAFQRSFDGLDENEKNIFLDLACFFKGENKDYVVKILDACGFFAYLGICDLIDESLISLLDNWIDMPVPFQDMGRFVVHQEHEDPCERSRLWDSNDIADVLTNNSGTEAIEGIFLDMSELVCELCPNVFSKMYRLRLLKLHCSTVGNQCKLSLPRGLETLPDELRLLHWEYYPLEYLPQKFNTENLVEIYMPYSNITKLWEGKKNFEKLRRIKLSHSRKLSNILVLEDAVNLEHIDLEGCTSLVDVSSSIPRGGKLISLNMKNCSHLQKLPPMTDLTSLELLNFSGCLELEYIPDLAPNTNELHRRVILPM